MTPFGQNVDNNGANSNANAGKLSFGERIGSKLQYAKTQLLGGGSLNSSNRVSTSVSNENASGVDSTEESISENGEPLRIGTNKNMEQNDSEETNTNEQIENNDVLRKTDDEENKNESKDELEKENRSKIEKAIEQTKRGKKTSNITEEEEENTDKKEEGKDKENSDSQKNQEIDSDQFKNLYKEISSNIANLHEAEELLEQKLESIGENLEPDEKKTIENNINKLDFEDAKEYVDSLEGTPQGEYAKTYLNLSETKKAIGNEEDKVDSLIDEGAKSGLIDKATEAALIAGGSVGLSALSKVKSNKPRKEDEKAIIEEGEEIESTEFLNPEIKAQHEISASAVKDEIIKDKTFGDLTKENAKILNELEGEVTIQGDISDEKLREFNIKILNKVRNNAYSQSNFQEAQNRVRKEGIKAMRKLQDFRNNPNVETARELSPGGKEYAKLMVEAQQAEMIIRAVKVSTEENTTVDKKVTESVTQTSSSVLNNLSNRRKNAMK